MTDTPVQMDTLFAGDAFLSASGRALLDELTQQLESIGTLGLEERVFVINELRRVIHEHSPFKDEPVDCVEWIRSEEVTANDYNPNSVAPPEMQLLEHSIAQDGYTQPIVAWGKQGHYEVVDGFHRNRVGRESATVVMVASSTPTTSGNATPLGSSRRSSRG